MTIATSPGNPGDAGHLPWQPLGFWPTPLGVLVTLATSPGCPVESGHLSFLILGTLATFPGSLGDSGHLPWLYCELWALARY